MQDDGLLVTQSTPICFVEIVSMTGLTRVVQHKGWSRLIMMGVPSTFSEVGRQAHPKI
ncbi:hypothetical protein PspLS_01529 [Pyricularia sp. CBS 133598]|nr:hypothetical protein PspLS_01529 [Pyricularia sp. CBS 133598]